MRAEVSSAPARCGAKEIRRAKTTSGNASRMALTPGLIDRAILSISFHKRKRGERAVRPTALDRKLFRSSLHIERLRVRILNRVGPTGNHDVRGTGNHLIVILGEHRLARDRTARAHRYL